MYWSIGSLGGRSFCLIPTYLGRFSFAGLAGLAVKTDECVGVWVPSVVAEFALPVRSAPEVDEWLGVLIYAVDGTRDR